jgi:branched-subunit amino acid ABC-type transport system permease component
MGFEQFFLQFLSGISVGMGIYLVASGLIIVFSVMDVLNFSHGALYMVGAYTMCSSMTLLAGVPGRFYLSIIITSAIVALIGGLIELFTIRRVYGQHLLYQLLISFGLIWVIHDIVKMIWGTQYTHTYPPAYMAGPARIFGVIFPKYNLIIIFVGAFVFAVSYFLLQKTKWGALIRAITTEPEMARVLGHNVSRIFLVVFMIGCLLAGFGGAVTAPNITVTLGIDLSMVLSCFIVIVLGGIGSLVGALVGSLILGLVQSFGVIIVPELTIGLPYMLILIVLFIRPQGLFGKPVTR